MLKEHRSDNSNRHKTKMGTYTYDGFKNVSITYPQCEVAVQMLIHATEQRNLVKLTKNKAIQCRNINHLTTYNTTAKQVKGCKVKYTSKSVNLKCDRINKNLMIIMIYRRKVTNTFVCSYHARHTKSTYNENLQQKQGGLI
jgi:hypothetical protein